MSHEDELPKELEDFKTHLFEEDAYPLDEKEEMIVKMFIDWQQSRLPPPPAKPPEDVQGALEGKIAWDAIKNGWISQNAMQREDFKRLKAKIEAALTNAGQI